MTKTINTKINKNLVIYKNFVTHSDVINHIKREIKKTKTTKAKTVFKNTLITIERKNLV